jgi:hypothetical protein
LRPRWRIQAEIRTRATAGSGTSRTSSPLPCSLTLPGAGRLSVARPFATVGVVDLLARWWNGQRDRAARRDIWLASDGVVWTVRARHGAAGEVRYEFAREYEARAMVDRLIAAAPCGWKDITRLVRKPGDLAEPTAASEQDESA